MKIVVTRSHFLKLKCTKFDFGWRFTPRPPYRLALCVLAMPLFLPNPKYVTLKIQHCVVLYVFLCIYARPSGSQCRPQLQWRSQRGGQNSPNHLDNT